jgi:hypothetical protein
MNTLKIPILALIQREREHLLLVSESRFEALNGQVVEGLVPVIKPEDYLTKSRQRRIIKPKRFDDYVNTNIVENSVKNNTKSFDRINCVNNFKPDCNIMYIKT